ncbi:MAG: hypothetical protein IT449_01815 [Phycisphaerales bacterium]|nr:hypothetical protein [Phycisphaerales bacterium]
MIRKEIDDLMHRVPFQPFAIQLTSGDRYEVRDAALAAMLRSAIFIAFPKSDERVIVPYLHIAAAETGNGTHKPSARKRRN